MTVRVVAFARLRELLGFSQCEFDLPEGSRVDDAWNVLAMGVPAIADLRASTRIACNGGLAEGARVLCAGDELALLPPVGGG